MKVSATLLLTACIFASAASDYIPVIVERSGTEDVEKFSTVVHFYLDLMNNGGNNVNVTVSPKQCCLIIEAGDIDCKIIELRPPVILRLGPRIDQFVGNNSGRALFMFRNLYSRYRKGNCSFEITAGKDIGFVYTLEYNTAPTINDIDTPSCTGIDQDADRACSPADCAIKYKGRRNFYRNATGKCEAVVQCDTRGQDDIEIIAYYDWESNICHRLDFEDNTFSEVESDTEIPVEIDPSQSMYFPNLQSQRLKNIIDGEEKEIQCNHGVQNGIYCECDEGYMSSGIHEDDPLIFHWCDTEMVDRSGIVGEPVKLSKPVEIIVIITLSLLNICLLLFWFYLAYQLFLKEKCQRACSDHKEPSYTLLEQN
ncbi:uncharacterized protein LOC135350151 [Halichondria panicea]|uniref:uncharacterized protein LOC135350151 n=1 Tax=Halichondria panicea TaxID=6063 RepID=UPI00312BB1D6